MNQKYKDKYEELRNNDPGAKQSNDDTNPKEDDFYATPGNVRNIGFVWEDGRRIFFNYAYLVSVKFELMSEQNLLTLTFTTDVITITGFGLDKIYQSIFNQKSRLINVATNRYNNQEDETYVTEIIIGANSS